MTAQKAIKKLHERYEKNYIDPSRMPRVDMHEYTEEEFLQKIREEFKTKNKKPCS